MSELLEKIHKYVLSNGFTEKEFAYAKHDSVLLANLIGLYAHRNQKRVNGESYFSHPNRMFESYYYFLQANPNKGDAILFLEDNECYGVREVCFLHDVVEDADISFEDIKNLYYECNLNRFYDLYINKPLRLITHIKGMPYDDYITLVLESRIASYVKMLDLVDNLNILSLDKLDDKTYLRSINYLNYIHRINNKYHFVEMANNYRNKISFS